MRWKLLWSTMALLLTVVSGCKQRCFMTEADFSRTTTSTMDHLELAPDLSTASMIKPSPSPMTLNDLDRKVRFISLAECIAIALEQGRVGQPSLLFPGTAQDNLVQFTGRGITGSDSIRVLALDPARAGTEIEAALSKFDAHVITSMSWQTSDEPPGTRGFFEPRQQAQAASTVIKPLATGGTAGITFRVPYQNDTRQLQGQIFPNYNPVLTFGFEQPLLQGYGVEMNQLRASHPGPTQTSVGSPTGLNGINFATTGEGILISRLRFDQQRADFERVVNQMLLNVEVAYWNLYGAYWTLYSREQGLQFAFTSFRLSKAKLEAGKISAAAFYQSRGQYELFRAQRLQAIDAVLESERQLRGLLGMPVEDGTRLMPSDSPTLAPYLPDWNAALQETLVKRPELIMTRQEIKASQMNLKLAMNQLLPDVRFTASYDITGVGTQLDGGSGSTPVTNSSEQADNQNALRSLADGNFQNWGIGIRAVVPLGFRFGHSQVRQAQLTLTRAMETLKDQELKAESFLYLYYKRLSTAYETIKANRAQREAFGKQLETQQLEYDSGRGTLDTLLEAQRFWADALSTEFLAIVTYNNSLAGFEFAKGSIMQHDNVSIAEGQLPTCASVRAVEHEKKRTAALVLREHAAPMAPISTHEPTKLIPSRAVSLPAVMSSSAPLLKDAPVLPSSPEGTVTAPQPLKPEEVFPQAVPATPVPTDAPTPPSIPPLPSAVSGRTTDFGTGRGGR